MKDENVRELEGIIEALLFAADTPLSLGEIKGVLREYPADAVAGALGSVIECYRSDERPLQIVEVAGGYQFTTKARYYRWIRALHRSRREGRLSGAALETLAVIAYKQPVPRSEIERIRGVNVDGVIRTLMNRDLIRIAGREKRLGRALLYGTTQRFLLNFGLKDLGELPSYEEIERMFVPPEDRGGLLISGLEEKRAGNEY